MVRALYRKQWVETLWPAPPVSSETLRLRVCPPAGKQKKSDRVRAQAAADRPLTSKDRDAGFATTDLGVISPADGWDHS